jgi:hypothetical protein
MVFLLRGIIPAAENRFEILLFAIVLDCACTR